MFGVWLRLVHVPWNSLGLGLADRGAESHEFLTRQKPLATILLERLDPAGRIVAPSNDADRPAKAYMLPITARTRLAWNGVLELPVQPSDLRPGQLVGLGSPKLRLDDLFDQVSIEGDRPGSCVSARHAPT